MSGFGKKNQGGLRVAHDFDDFMEDREVILTLQDSYLLDNQDVNRNGDVLENIDMAEVYKSQVGIENRTKKDDLLDSKYGATEKKILPQYDEKSTEKEGIMLDSLGEFNLERQRKIESIKNKLAGSKKGGEISLETSKNVASEYFTSDEMKKIKKPLKKAVNVQKNRADILKFLEDSLEDEEGNLGSRDAQKTRERADLEDVTTKKLKTENYEAALEKAREKTKYAAMIDEEYDDIQRSIENQRRAAQQKKNKVEDVVRTLIETNKTANEISQDVVVLDSNKKKPADAEFIELDSINASTEFLRGVATRDVMTEQKSKITEPVSLSLRDTKNGTASVVNVSLPSEKLLAWKSAQSGLESLKSLRKEAPVEKTEKNGASADAVETEDVYTKEDLEQLNEERNFIEEDDLNKGGLAAALKAARERGYLMENEVEVRGRANDKTYREELSKFNKKEGEDQVRLEYRDKNGRIMTPKEAFRYQCRIFHGIDQSKTKQEKERKKHEAARKLLQTAPQETASMKALQKLQNQNSQAYVVLDTKNMK